VVLTTDDDDAANNPNPNKKPGSFLSTILELAYLICQ
jgi:hypothetical protein